MCGFVDIAANPRRPLREHEIVGALQHQVVAAKKIGFEILRVQHATPAILERLVPDAERYGVTLAVEINSPMRIDGPEVLETLELIERMQSPHLGFLADFGTTARKLSAWLTDVYRAKGVASDVIEMVLEAWNRASAESQMQLRDELDEKLRADGAGEVAHRFLNHAFILFGRDEPECWRELLPHVVHTHVKLFETDQSGADPCVPYDALIPMFARAGYVGVFSWEYEGWLWAASPRSVPWHGPSAVEAIGAHQRYVRKILAG
jgi:hypothetical protein